MRSLRNIWDFRMVLIDSQKTHKKTHFCAYLIVMKMVFLDIAGGH